MKKTSRTNHRLRTLTAAFLLPFCNVGLAQFEYSPPAVSQDLGHLINVVAQNVAIQDNIVTIETISPEEGLTQNDTSANSQDNILPDITTARVDPDAQNSTADQLSEGDAVTLNFQDADIRALINTVSQVTGRNFVVDPRVKGRVTLVSGSKIPADQLYDIFLSVLSVHNFSAVPGKNVIKILPSNLVKQTPTPTEFTETERTNDSQITQIYQLKHALVQELVPILRPLLPPTSHFAAHAGSNTFVFTDTASNIQRVLLIIKQLDKPDRRSDVHVVYLKHANAARLAQIVTQTASTLSGTPAEGQVSRKPISVQSDPALNALIIQSPEAEFRLLQALIDQLDVERVESGKIHVVYLKYAKATDMVGLLGQVVQDRAAGGEGAVPTETPISVQADEDTNALVIRAEDDDFQDLKSVIEKLDLRRAQVFVETIIAEISTDKSSDLGVEWTALYNTSSGDRVSVDTTGFTDGAGGLNVGVVTDTMVQNLAGDSLVPDLNAVLHALRSDRNANILSTPNLLTLDNETAEIIVGQEVPFITGQFTTSSGGTTTTTTNTDNTSTTATGVNPFQTIERKDVGLTLRITPQINEGGAIRLEIEQETSSVSPTTVAGASDLITDTRSLNATVQVDDGQIIVLGGLIRDDVQDTIEWVPVLGRIPLIGTLFRKKTKMAVKTNLMVFLRPKIIRTPEDLADFTRDRYEYIRAQESTSLPDTRQSINKAKPPTLPKLRWDTGSQDK